MSSDIGPGAIVQAVRTSGRFGWRITRDALYRVGNVLPERASACRDCGRTDVPIIQLVGQHHGFKFAVPFVSVEFRPGWCPCDFRPWPPEPEAEIASEDIEWFAIMPPMVPATI